MASNARYLGGVEGTETMNKTTTLISNDQIFDLYLRDKEMIGYAIGSKGVFKTERGARQAARSFWRREDETCEPGLSLVILGPSVNGFDHTGSFRLMMVEK